MMPMKKMMIGSIESEEAEARAVAGAATRPRRQVMLLAVLTK